MQFEIKQSMQSALRNCLILLSMLLATLPTSAFAQAGNLPDLVVQNVQFETTGPYPGFCQAKFTIANQSSNKAERNFPFIAWPLNVPAWGPGPQVGWSETILGLEPFTHVVHIWPKVRVFGDTIYVRVDPQNSVPESDETNNESSFPVPPECQVKSSGVDFVPTHIAFEKAGNMCRARVTICNIGDTGTATNIDSYLADGQSVGYLLGYIGGWNPGQCRTHQPQPFITAAPGLSVSTDVTQQVLESHEDNNKGYFFLPPTTCQQ
ncbi:MAG: hypothetical protein U0350_17965 [Caldilineaceae bacterium]